MRFWGGSSQGELRWCPHPASVAALHCAPHPPQPRALAPPRPAQPFAVCTRATASAPAQPRPAQPRPAQPFAVCTRATASARAQPRPAQPFAVCTRAAASATAPAPRAKARARRSRFP